MKNIVAVGISSDISSASFVERKLDALLKNITEFELIAINDNRKIISSYATTHSISVEHRAAAGRIGTKQSLAKATHLVVFWAGNDLSELIFFGLLNKIPTKIVPIAVTTVANKDRNDQFDIYIGRGSPWGNPFPIDHGSDVDRDAVIERYRTYFFENIVSNPEKQKQLLGLRGLRLGCHCKPLACHGDIIANYLNELPPRED